MLRKDEDILNLSELDPTPPTIEGAHSSQGAVSMRKMGEHN
jgi:hypothetical protein